jgi:EmrB/QacA subfamily drug resistance transporter
VGERTADAAGAHPEPVVDRRAWQALGVVIVGSLVISLDTTMANLALPKVVERFPGADVEWVVTVYLIGLGLSQPGAAWVIDRVGSRRTFLGSIALLSASACGAGLAPSFGVLVTCRLFQGVAGGALIPVSLAVLAFAFPPERRGWVMGLWSTVSMVAPAIGPLVGGYLLTNASWRWAFLIHVPAGVIATIAAYLFLGEYGEIRRTPLDVTGWALCTVGLLSLLILFAQADEWGWTGPRSLAAVLLAVGALTAFVRQQRRGTDTLLALEIFRAPGFSLIMVAMAFGSIAYVARLTFMPLELTAVRGLDPLHIGWLLMPAAVGSMLASAVCGRLIASTGARPLIMVGGLVMTISHLALGVLGVATAEWWIALVMAAQIVGATFVVLPATIAALDSLPARFAGQVAMVRSMVRQVSAAFGVAVLASLYRSDIGDRATEAAAPASAVQSAYNKVFLWMTLLGVATMLVAPFLPKRATPGQAAGSADVGPVPSPGRGAAVSSPGSGAS